MSRFDVFVDDALYGPDGFYTVAGRAGGDDGDFTTSVETSALFGSCVARRLDEIWAELDRPDPFVVVEGGAGPGRLCRDVFLAVDACRDALRYVMVERSDRQRAGAFERVVEECFPGDEEVPLAVTADLPRGPLTGVVLANELLDNLPPRLLERVEAGWVELFVSGGRFVPVPAEGAAARMADALVPDAPIGCRVPLQLKAAVWVRRAIELLERGRVVVFDYGRSTTAGLASRPMQDWLRTYRRHRRGGDPLAEPGHKDITCEVGFDQLPPGALLAEQAAWLDARGLSDLTVEARNRWDAAASSPTAADLAARTLLEEAAKLTDPAQFGGFLVAEWLV